MSEDISTERMVQNGLDIVDAVPGVGLDHLLNTVVSFTQTSVVHWLNNNGHAVAAQALDDQWYTRDEQWWREPDGFDGHYKNGDEKRKEMFGGD